MKHNVFFGPSKSVSKSELRYLCQLGAGAVDSVETLLETTAVTRAIPIWIFGE